VPTDCDGRVCRLAEFLIARAAARELEPVKLVFDYSDFRRTGKISLVEELVGKTGFLSLTRVTVQALEREDHLLFSGHLDSGVQIDGEVCERLFNVDGRVSGPAEITPEVRRRLEEQMELSRSALLTRVAERNGHFFEEEIEKLERWAEDLKDGLEQLKDVAQEQAGFRLS
jgi:adenine-specific DNA-methyltransferase